ncbi:MAG: glycosyl hydrolase family 17 protein [Anaerolineales bacterium]
MIGETGWPSTGPSNSAAVPSPENQNRFAKEFLTLALSDNVDFYYFDAFDEMWKTEGGVGPHWGILNANRVFKSDIQSVISSYNVVVEPWSGKSEVALTPVDTSSSVSPSHFYVYSTFGNSENHFAPGGWMGDRTAIKLDTCWQQGQPWPETVIRASYVPSEDDTEGWAGVYWLQPDGNWGTVPNAGFNLSKYKQLVFRARAESAGTQIKFFIGGVSKDATNSARPLPYPSSISTPIFAQEADRVDGFINLADVWQEYHIDLTGMDLHSVIDGFGWAAEKARTPQGATFYIDEIYFVTTAPDLHTVPPLHIYSGKSLRKGLSLGVEFSGHSYNWVKDLDGQIQVNYPPGQQWGAVFVTVGKPSSPGYRAGVDLSQYRSISMEMRGESNDQVVLVGLKDSSQKDDGSETLVPISLSSKWATYTLDLDTFIGADLTQVYIPVEFVFRENNTETETIYFRNIQYLP